MYTKYHHNEYKRLLCLVILISIISIISGSTQVHKVIAEKCTNESKDNKIAGQCRSQESNTPTSFPTPSYDEANRVNTGADDSSPKAKEKSDDHERNGDDSKK
jgi:hypothetical protein